MRRVILLDQTDTQDGLFYSLNLLFWFPVTSGQRPQSSGSLFAAASDAENADIKAGNVVEEPHTVPVPVGAPATTIESLALETWANRKAVRDLQGGGRNTLYGRSGDDQGNWS
jgi:hypothetical protein